MVPVPPRTTRKIVICTSALEPQKVSVPSAHSDEVYEVMTPTIYKNGSCECEGYKYRGTCSHLRRADMEFVCGFADTDLNIERCPLCGKETAVVVVDY